MKKTSQNKNLKHILIILLIFWFFISCIVFDDVYTQSSYFAGSFSSFIISSFIKPYNVQPSHQICTILDLKGRFWAVCRTSGYSVREGWSPELRPATSPVARISQQHWMRWSNFAMSEPDFQLMFSPFTRVSRYLRNARISAKHSPRGTRGQSGFQNELNFMVRQVCLLLMTLVVMTLAG